MNLGSGCLEDFTFPRLPVGCEVPWLSSAVPAMAALVAATAQAAIAQATAAQAAVTAHQVAEAAVQATHQPLQLHLRHSLQAQLTAKMLQILLKYRA